MSRICLNCGVEFEAPKGKGAHARFHAASCRKAWNNRRAERGVQLYDLFMELRYNRAAANDEKLWSVMTNLARAFRDADNAKRGGRRSWDSEAAGRVPLAFGRDGDKR